MKKILVLSQHVFTAQSLCVNMDFIFNQQMKDAHQEKEFLFFCNKEEIESGVDVLLLSGTVFLDNQDNINEFLEENGYPQKVFIMSADPDTLEQAKNTINSVLVEQFIDSYDLTDSEKIPELKKLF